MKKKSTFKEKFNKKKVRVFLLICFVFIIHAFSSITYANNIENLFDNEQIIITNKITLDIKDKSLRHILDVIHDKTGYGIIFKDIDNIDDLNNLSISVKNAYVEDVLKKILKNTGLTYIISRDSIIVKVATVTTSEFKENTTIKGISILGRVIDKNKNPIVGATIVVNRTSRGAITNDKGEFKIEVYIGDTIEISCIGMVTQVLNVIKKMSNIVIKMEHDAIEVEDVVVTGYGNVRKSSYTGNAVTVSRDQLMKVSKTNVIKAIQVFDPSFRIKDNNQWGSDPNALPEMSIRGESGIGIKQLDRDELSKSSLKDNPNLPTFIMDGFEISVQKLYDFDPNRIKTITILKDAAATALYGSRAANGVVVIETVTPIAGKVNVSYSFTGDVVFPDLSDYNLTNAAEKIEVERLAGYFSHKNEATQFRYEQEYHAKLGNIKRGVDTYWLSRPLNTVFNNKHSLYIDGGSKNLRFGFDVNYSDQNGVMKGSLRDRMGAGFYINYQYKGISVKNHTMYSQYKSEESPYGNFSLYSKALPYDEYLDDNGNYLENLKNWNESGSKPNINPLYESGLQNFNRSVNENILNNLSVNWNINKDVLLKAQLSLTKDMGKSERFLDPLSKQNKTVLGLNNISSGELTNGINSGFTIDATTYLSYNKDFGKSNINALGGFNIKESISTSSSEYFEGFPSGSLSSPNYAQKSPTKPIYNESTSRLIGFMASVNYSYSNIYLLDVSMRLDGSSAFGSENRFAPFWSFGLGINIHNYEFMQDSKVFNLMKIRGSYGQTGKANFPAYTAITSYVAITDEWYKTGYGAHLQALGNKNLTWETTNTFDIGGELGLFNGLIYLKGSYYHKKTIDLINDVTIPLSTGFTTYKDNIGEILNEGFELDFRISVLRTKNSNLIINANIAKNKNTILKISESLKAYNESIIAKFNNTNHNDPDNDTSMPFLQYTEGGSLSSIWGVMSQGINPATGEEIYVTQDGLLVDTWNTSNQQVLGTTEPKGQGAIGINYTYKRFSIYASFMYEFGSQRYNQTLVDKVENVNVYEFNVDKRVLTDRWTKPGDIAMYKSLIADRSVVNRTRPTSRFVQDYNVLSLNSINISYDIPEQILKPLHLSMIRLEVGANDIFRTSTVEQERGLSYPFARTVNFSIKATF